MSDASDGFTLDPQLARDTMPVGDLPLSRVLLINDANYPWLLLVPRRRGAIEIIDLATSDRAQLMTEISHAARTLKELSGCDKINIAALGNVVAQLHVHVIARSRGDAAWPKPVWGAAPAKAYDKAQTGRVIDALRQQLTVSPV
jgi:diadenosine tetraphosphate (Ap4A) HIT family hydrolase